MIYSCVFNYQGVYRDIMVDWVGIGLKGTIKQHLYRQAVLTTEEGTSYQRRSQDFCLGGATRLTPPDTFCVVSGSRPDSVGGGVVAEIFRGPRERTRISGGGVVAEMFRVPRQRARFRIQWGGVVAGIFRDLPHSVWGGG